MGARRNATDQDPTPRARSGRAIAWAIAVVGALLAVVAVALGPMALAWRDKDRNLVRLAWDPTTQRLVINEPVREPLAPDGPYVRRRSDGTFVVMRVVERTPPRGPAQWRADTAVMPSGSTHIEVLVDNPARTRFQVRLRPPATPRPAISPMPARLLLASDFEGQFDAFVGLLQAQGVIDAQLHWRYGTGHLALAGDMVDRGPNVLPLLWLVYRLEDEAARAGGGVHYVLGNHELLDLQGRFKYVPRRIFASRDAFFGGDNRRVFAADTVLGQWLRAQPVIERIGDVLIVHGGISGEFLDQRLDIEAANAVARRELDVRLSALSAPARPVLGEPGPTRYRGMARLDKAIEPDQAAHLDAVLARYGVRWVAIGHTIVPHATLEQSGRLMRLDVDHARQRSEGLLIEDGRVFAVDAAGGRVRMQ